MKFKLGHKTRRAIEVLVESAKLFATINIVLLIADWIGFFALHESYQIKGGYGFISMICLYILSVAIHLYLLKDE